jgi:hypothetical protein
MVANNFQAMLFARDLATHPLMAVDVLDLHRILTEDTLLDQPPPAEELPDRLDALCRFANGESPTGFIHPVVRAIIVHFCLAYDHPFADGNGRAAPPSSIGRCFMMAREIVKTCG